MSDSTHEYRAFIVSVSKLLKAEEVFELATIWLGGKTDVSVYEPAEEKKSLGLKLFIAMDCSGILSWTDLGGLLKILKSVNRYDLVNMVESFINDKGKSCSKRYTKKKRAKSNQEEEERKQLQLIYENLVMRSLDMERQIIGLRTILRKEDPVLDDGVRVVQGAESVAQSLAAELERDLNMLVRRSRADSSTSSSSDESNGSSRRNSRILVHVSESIYGILQPDIGVVTNTAQAQPHHQLPSVQNRDRPIPKPRSLKTQPCYPISVQETQSASELAPDISSSVPKNPALSRSKYVPSTLTFGTKPQTEAATEEDDCTGDSGVGTGSGSAKYGDVEDWKRGITKPPPVPGKDNNNTLQITISTAKCDLFTEKPASRSHRRATTDVEGLLE
jgi:hypothetical protein